jgi:hypothetical protein
MKTSFQFIALPYEQFAHLFNSSDSELEAAGACLKKVDQKPGFPCRVSLVDAEVGETVLLTHFTHHDVASPYRGSGAIYIRRGAATTAPAVNEIPFMFTHRLLSVRGYDTRGMLLDTGVVEGSELADLIEQLFSNNRVNYLHIHNAGPGCFNCSVVRA